MTPRPVSLYHFLFGDLTVTAATVAAAAALARPRLAALGLGRNAATFLGHVLAWWYVMHRAPFFKFNEPCAHPACRPGDSWVEELALGIRAFRTARTAVASKVTTGSSKNELLGGTALTAIVLYWTDEERRTHYYVNEALLCRLLGAAHGLVLAPDGAESPTPHSPTVRPGPLLESAAPRPVTSSTQFFKEEEREERAADVDPCPIATALQDEGVFPEAAAKIAQRAQAAGLDVAATLTLFAAHVEQARRSRSAENAVAIATWRLQRGRFAVPGKGGGARQRQLVAALRDEAPPAAEPHQAGQDGVPAENAPSDPGVPPATRQSATERLWRQVLVDLEQQMSRATFDRWLRDSRLVALDGEAATVAVSSRHAIPWLEGRLQRVVQATLAHHLARPVGLRYVVQGTGELAVPPESATGSSVARLRGAGTDEGAMGASAGLLLHGEERHRGAGGTACRRMP